MKSNLIESIFNNPINEQSFEISEKNEFNLNFDTEYKNENETGDSSNEDFLMRVYYIIDKDYNKPFSNSYNLSKEEPNTEPNSKQKFMNTKRKRTKVQNNMNTEEQNIKDDVQNVIIPNKKVGRRIKGKNYKEDAKHTKMSDDNIIRKIKTSIFDYILKKLNNSIKFKSGKFRSLNKEWKERLKKKEQMELLNKTIFEIYTMTKMNKVGEKKGNNEKLIEKIYEENKELETISILSKTFQEILNEVREEKTLDSFLEKIKEKEIKNEKKYKNKIKNDFDIELYMDKIRKLLLGYEEWFQNKKGRNTKKIYIEI